MARRDNRNRAHYWRDRNFPGLTLLCADFTTQEFALHSHDALVIAATEFGGAEVRSRGEIQQAESSSLFVFNPAEPHAGQMGASNRWCYRSLYLTESALDAVGEGLGIPDLPYFTSNRLRDPGLLGGFLSLHRALQDGTDALREEELMLASFGSLFARYGGRRPAMPEGRNDALVTRAVSVMSDRYHEAITLDDLSLTVGLRKIQLINLFNRAMGMGPHAYLTQIRLREACHRLKRGQAPASVAAETGFYDQSAMNRHFKRAYGITPLQYARA